MKVRVTLLAFLMAIIPACKKHHDDPISPPIYLSPAFLLFTGIAGGANPATQLVQLTNPNGSSSTLNWIVSSDKPWLQFTPYSGTTTTETDIITVSAILGQAEAWTTATSTTGAPTGLEEFSLTWTGSEMIVWGGHQGGLINTGSRYDLATNTWVGVTSVTNAPVARWQHTGVWTGSQMIIWGGNSALGAPEAPRNDGQGYNPTLDSWSSSISTVNAPSARRSHKAVWTGTEMIVWGGTDGVGPLNTGGRYRPSDNTWSPISTTGAPSARWSHSAAWTGTEMIVWGGYDGVGFVNTGARYNPSTDTWSGPTSTTGAPIARITHSAIWTGTEMIVWGGDDGSGMSLTGGRYSPLTDTWLGSTTTTNAPTARRVHRAIWTGNEMVIWGGYDGGFTNTGKRYKPPISLAAGTYTGTLSITDPLSTISPQTVDVTFVVSP